MPSIFIGGQIKTFSKITYVSPNGYDTIADGSLQKPYKSMLKAVNATADGNCIYFLPGTHNFTSAERLGESQFPCYGRNLFFCSDMATTKIIMTVNATSSYEGRCYYFAWNYGTITNLNITINSLYGGSQYANCLFVCCQGTFTNNIIHLNCGGSPSFWYDNNNSPVTINNNVIYMPSYYGPYSGNPKFIYNITNQNSGRSGNLVTSAASSVNPVDFYKTEGYGIFEGLYPVYLSACFLKCGDKNYVLKPQYYDRIADKFIPFTDDEIKLLFASGGLASFINFFELFGTITVTDPILGSKTIKPMDYFDIKSTQICKINCIADTLQKYLKINYAPSDTALKKGIVKLHNPIIAKINENIKTSFDFITNNKYKVIIKCDGKYYGANPNNKEELKETELENILTDGIDYTELKNTKIDFDKCEVYIAISYGDITRADADKVISGFKVIDQNNILYRKLNDKDITVYNNFTKIMINFINAHNQVRINKITNHIKDFEVKDTLGTF